MYKTFYLAQGTTDSSTQDLTQQATKKLNALQRYWQSINWDHIFAVVIEKTLYLFFVVVLFGILNKIGKTLIHHFYERYQKSSTLSDSRLKTINTLINNVFQYTLFFFFIYSVLSIIGVPVGSLLAGAGIAGLAIGLGAQGFMNDIITGFFIILEQQMDVGDYIKLANLSIEGTVTSVGIRSIQLKSSDGTVHFIPNRNITTISNQSRSNMQVIVEVRINPDEDYEGITAIIHRVNQELADKHAEIIKTGPTLFGMVDIGNGNYAVRSTMYVVNGSQFRIKEEFLATYIRELSEAGFTIPNTPIISAK